MHMKKEQRRLTVRHVILICSVAVVSTFNGCGQPPEHMETQICANATTLALVSNQAPSELGPTSLIRQPEPGMEVFDPGSIPIDHTKHGCPPKLLAKATKVLGGHLMHAWDGTSTTKKSYFFVAVSGQQGLFLEKDGDYIYVNSGAELVGINEILGESKFTRRTSTTRPRRTLS